MKLITNGQEYKVKDFNEGDNLFVFTLEENTEVKPQGEVQLWAEEGSVVFNTADYSDIKQEGNVITFQYVDQITRLERQIVELQHQIKEQAETMVAMSAMRR